MRASRSTQRCLASAPSAFPVCPVAATAAWATFASSSGPKKMTDISGSFPFSVLFRSCLPGRELHPPLSANSASRHQRNSSAWCKTQLLLGIIGFFRVHFGERFNDVGAVIILHYCDGIEFLLQIFFHLFGCFLVVYRDFV